MQPQKQSNLEIAMRTMKVIALLDKQIVNCKDMMEAILQDECIICFHLHHDLLYHNEFPKEEADPYDDLMDETKGYKTPNGQVIIPPPFNLPPNLRDKMLNPDEIRQLMQFQQFNPANHPPARQSSKYKLNTAITGAVLQVIYDGFVKERQKCIDKLEFMGLDISNIVKQESQ